MLYTIRACVEQQMERFQSKAMSIDIQSAWRSCTIADLETLGLQKFTRTPVHIWCQNTKHHGLKAGDINSH